MTVGKERGMREQGYCKESKGRQRESKQHCGYFKILSTVSLVNLIDPSRLLFSRSHLPRTSLSISYIEQALSIFLYFSWLDSPCAFSQLTSLMSHQVFVTFIWKYHLFFFQFSVYSPISVCPCTLLLWSNCPLSPFFFPPVRLFSSPFLDPKRTKSALQLTGLQIVAALWTKEAQCPVGHYARSTIRCPRWLCLIQLL